MSTNATVISNINGSVAKWDNNYVKKAGDTMTGDLLTTLLNATSSVNVASSSGNYTLGGATHGMFSNSSAVWIQ
jgi:hypothetical protein